MSGLRRRPNTPTTRQPSRGVTSRRDFFSYHASRQTGGSTNAGPEVRQTIGLPQVKSISSRVLRRPLTVATVVLLVVCIGYNTTLVSQPRFIITTESTKKALRPATDYQKEAQVIISKSILNKSKLTFASSEVERELQKKFPDLSDISVALPFMGRRPLIRAVAEQPELALSTGRGVFLVAASGRVLAKTSEIANAGGLTIPSIEDQAELTVEPGKAALSKQDVTFITTLLKQFEHNKTEVSTLTLPPLASELQVRVAGKPYYIKFSMLSDARVTAGQYFALADKLARDGITPAEYIDSRIEERVYYK